MAIYVPGEFFLIIFIKIKLLLLSIVEIFPTILEFGLLPMRQF